MVEVVLAFRIRRPVRCDLIEHATVHVERAGTRHRRLAVTEVRPAEHPDVVDRARIDQWHEALLIEDLLVVDIVGPMPPASLLEMLLIDLRRVAEPVLLDRERIEVAPLDDAELH